MPEPTAVVFDLDGTLIDSAPALHHALDAALAAIGRPGVTRAQTVSFIGRGVSVLVRRALDATGGGDDALHAEALARFSRAYADTPGALTTLYPGALDALDALADAGFALGLCTNKPQGPTDATLATLGIADRFKAVVGGSPNRPLKPDPAPLRLCLTRLGAGRALYVGDSETDAATAQAVALPFALFTRGYRASPPEAIPAAWRFDDFAALPGAATRLAAAPAHIDASGARRP